MHLVFFHAKARQFMNVSCPDHFLLLWLGIICFPVQACEELSIFVPNLYQKFSAHPSWGRWRMTCFEVNILKQSIINGTVGTVCSSTPWAAQPYTRAMPFRVWQEANQITAALECAFGILSDNSVLVFSLPLFSQGQSFLFASTISLLSRLHSSVLLWYCLVSALPLRLLNWFSTEMGVKGTHFCSSSDSLTYCFCTAPAPSYIHVKGNAQLAGGCWGWLCYVRCSKGRRGEGLFCLSRLLRWVRW